jgi:ribosomal protein S12 methylthiotransferase
MCNYVRGAKFEHLGCFPYSREEGTPAYDFDDQIDEQVKQDRADLIMQIQMEINEQRSKTLIGKTFEVLVEDFDPVSEQHYGRSVMDSPEIDGKIFFSSSQRLLPGTFVPVEIRRVLEYDLVGRAILKKREDSEA